MQRHHHQVGLPEPQQLGRSIVRASVAFARRYRTLTGTYLVGLIVLMIFYSGGRPLTYEQDREYRRP